MTRATIVFSSRTASRRIAFSTSRDRSGLNVIVCQGASSCAGNCMKSTQHNVQRCIRPIVHLSLFLFFPMSRVRCCLQLFHRHLLVFSTLLCLLSSSSRAPPPSCLLHISLYTALPSQPWPPSSPPALLA